MKLTAEQLETLCACGHLRKWHAKNGEPYSGVCVASGEGFRFCNCKRFQEHQFKSEEEIEMAKKSSKAKAPKGERQPRTQLVYTFNAEKARELRDGSYKEKNNLVAVTLRVLCASRKEGFTFDQMAALVKEETGKLPT